MNKLTVGRRVFLLANNLFLIVFAALCILPLINVLAISLSSSHAAAGGFVNTQLANNRTFQAAQVFLASLPVLILYPFLQKYFMKGLVMGIVKG